MITTNCCYMYNKLIIYTINVMLYNTTFISLAFKSKKLLKHTMHDQIQQINQINVIYKCN